MKRFFLLITLLSFTAACQRVPRNIEPIIASPPHPKEIQRESRGFLALPKDFSISPFPQLTCDEVNSDWGKEYQIALMFAEDFDLYRAITGFKRALYFLPPEYRERRLEIEYAITLAYYLGKKYVEAIYSVESTDLVGIDQNFPAFSDLLLVLYESYSEVGRTNNATHILNLIEKNQPDCAERLSLLSAIRRADFETIVGESECNDGYTYFDNILAGYERETKSVRKAQMLNAVLPGAGYWYVGQKATAVTALIVNALFIGAAIHFIDHGNAAAAAITLSLEGGWYFGGITGAGLAAKCYNEKLYASYANKITTREQLFPIMMLKYTF